MSRTAFSSELTEQSANSRARAERRRAVRQAVRAERERLAIPPTNDKAFDGDVLAAFARNRLGTAYLVPPAIAIVAALLLLWAPASLVLLWSASALGVHFAALLLSHLHITTTASAADAARWKRRLVGTDAFGGAVWGCLFLLLPIAEGSPATLFAMTTLLSLFMAIPALAAPLTAATVAAATPAALGFVAMCARNPTPLSMLLATAAVSLLCFSLLLARRNNAITQAMLKYRAQKDLLAAESETGRALSEESRRRAEEANLAKSRFLASMSHELRTPLNAILGFSEVMRNEVLGPVGNSTYKEYVTDIHDSGQHLLTLINEILDLSRIEAGRYELHEEAFDLAELAEDCAHLMQLKLREKNIALDEYYADEPPMIRADKRAARQVIFNLLANAIKFTPTGGTITLSVFAPDDGGIAVSVGDTGPGIPAAEIPVVLSAFGQGAIATRGAERGAGLGLPIVQALMHTHGGRFDLISKLREGTLATATFPQERVIHTPAAETSAATNDSARKIA
jgi:two-component system cell cycle sensor histidine kinase PleC